MRYLTAFFILGICFTLLWRAFWLRRDLSRRSPTMFDVRRLLIEGDKEKALQLYAAIFKTSRKEAKKGVEDLEKNIQGKNIRLED